MLGNSGALRDERFLGLPGSQYFWGKLGEFFTVDFNTNDAELRPAWSVESKAELQGEYMPPRVTRKPTRNSSPKSRI
jgi:hypothetical protein